MTSRSREPLFWAVILKSPLKYDRGSLDRFFSKLAQELCERLAYILNLLHFESLWQISRKSYFNVEMSYFITKMPHFCFSCDFVPPGGFQPVPTYSQGRIRMPTAPGGSKLYSPARNRSYFNQKVSYFIQNWRIWTFESPQRLPDVGFAIPTSILNTIPREWRSEFIFRSYFN